VSGVVRLIDNRALDASRPPSSNRGSEFYRALMVEAQRLQFEYESACPWTEWGLSEPLSPADPELYIFCRDEDFDVS